MPRKLPWASSSTTTRAKRPADTTVTKRQKVRKLVSDSEEEASVATSKKANSLNHGHPPSSSPPSDPPPESFMEEGKDNDDRYRMVEDEFLRVAQQFTAHLHAAEYKRQQKAVKSQNADTINSISRPVTGKMPSQTKRKLEAAALVKRQRAMIEGLTGKKESGVESDSDFEELPYIGTTLHGLMDSPRKKTASLAKLGSIATTRAAAGFKKPAIQSNGDQSKSLIDSPEPKHATRRDQVELSVDSTDDDDDLDAPIPAPKLIATARKTVIPSSLHASSTPFESTTIKKVPLVVTSPIIESESLTKAESSPKAPSKVVATAGEIVEGVPKLSRLERLRLARAKKDKEQQIKKEDNYNSIPTF
ncbi:hypothetical protein BKA64DRAFT_374615 [Cadophora sp. MPI-SDFR-AT-0126]|nr:hypothetical protein BKA64DRAFT_374615 [Leotiomycetes sp. MPI-SDFR-AT-0126]